MSYGSSNSVNQISQKWSVFDRKLEGRQCIFSYILENEGN